MDLHRDVADKIILKKKRKGTIKKRVSGSIDVWTDSGSVPGGISFSILKIKKLLKTDRLISIIIEYTPQVRALV